MQTLFRHSNNNVKRGLSIRTIRGANCHARLRSSCAFAYIVLRHTIFVSRHHLRLLTAVFHPPPFALHPQSAALHPPPATLLPSAHVTRHWTHSTSSILDVVPPARLQPATHSTTRTNTPHSTSTRQNLRRSSFVVRRSSFVVRRSSFVV